MLSTGSLYSKWDSYGREERHAPWKVLLPASAEKPILAVGLRGSDLASLGRSWKVVHVYKCSQRDISWATEQAEALGETYHFELIKTMGWPINGYSAIAVNRGFSNECNPTKMFPLLEPGGAVAWIDQRSRVPSVSQLIRSGYCNASNYAFLPPKTGVVLVPLGKHRTTIVGLLFYRPGKARNRFVLKMAKAASIVGLGSPLLGVKQVVVARKPGISPGSNYLLDWFGTRMGFPVLSGAIYSGWHYLTIQLLDSQASVVGVGRVADVSAGSEAIKNETNVLKRLTSYPQIRNYIPKVFMTDDWHGYTCQIQEDVAHAGGGFENKLVLSHLRFLSLLSEIDRCKMNLEEWPGWSQLLLWVQQNPSTRESVVLSQALGRCARAFRGKKLTVHRVHGDFKPGNVFVSSKGLKVIDWADSIPFGLPLYDAIYFNLYNHRFTKSIPSEELLTDPLSFLQIRGELGSLLSDIAQPDEIAILAVLTLTKCISNRKFL